MKKLFLLPFVLMACVQGTVSDQVVATTEINETLPNLPANLTGFVLPPTTVNYSQSLDISGPIQDVQKVGTPSLSISQNILHSNTGDFTFLDELKLSVVPDDASVQPVQLLDVYLTPDQKASSDLNLPITVDPTALVNAFGSGNVSLQFSMTVEGQVPNNGSLDLVSTMTMDVSVSVSKSVNDIGK